MRPNTKHTKGFTLIELLIATAVIALLGSIAVPMYRGYMDKVRTLEFEKFINDGKHTIQEMQLKQKEDGLRLNDSIRYKGKTIQMTAAGDNKSYPDQDDLAAVLLNLKDNSSNFEHKSGSFMWRRGGGTGCFIQYNNNATTSQNGFIAWENIFQVNDGQCPGNRSR